MVTGASLIQKRHAGMENGEEKMESRRRGDQIAGIDEVGRGPLAGPVVAAAVMLFTPLAGLADSKTLSRTRREKLAEALFASDRVKIGLGAASVAEIDRLNILEATWLAMQRAFDRLGFMADLVLVDGNRLPALPCPAEAIVGGDRLVPEISAASIVAKVTRDRLMTRLDERHPGYGWARNAGYPTEEHRKALMQIGPCCHHRRSFTPVKAAIEINRAQPSPGAPAHPKPAADSAHNQS